MLNTLILVGFAIVLAVAGVVAAILCMRAKDRLGKAAGLGAAGGVLLVLSQLANAGWQLFLGAIYSELGVSSGLIPALSALLGVLNLAAVLLLIFAVVAARNAPGAGGASGPPMYGPQQPYPGQQPPRF